MEPADPRQPVLLFLHLPKTGGTTLNKLVYKNSQTPGGNGPEDPDSESQLFSYAYGGIYHVRGGFNQPISEDDLRAIQREIDTDMPRVILGHFSFGFHDIIRDRPFAYVTMLRDPVDRVISLHSHLQRFDDDAGVEATRLTLRDFAAHGRIANDQARRLSGLEPELVSESIVLREAKKNLREHFLLAGVMERFDEVLVLLRRNHGWQHINYRPKLVDKNRSERAGLDSDVIDAIKAANMIDVQLFAYAQDLFQELVDREGPDFERDVSEFQRENRHFIEEHARHPVELEIADAHRSNFRG